VRLAFATGMLTLLIARRNSDSKGYVFEKAAIVAYVTSKSNGGDAHTRVQSPIAGAWLLPARACLLARVAETQRAGAAYKLTLGELTCASRLQRAAKRRQQLDSQQVRA
jgi:hypothetical protein